jgi:hypothetical protein
MEIMTFNDFFGEIYRVSMNNPNLRLGQIIMNCLFEIRPDKYNEITGTELDCFYSNYKKAGKTMTYLQNNWTNNETIR